MGGSDPLIRRSGNWKAFGDAWEACLEYLKSHPRGAASADIKTTLQLLRGIAAVDSASKGELLEPSTIADVMMVHFSTPVPPVLCNGLVASLRIGDPEKRQRARESIGGLVNGLAAFVSRDFEVRRSGLAELLVDGTPRAVRDGLTYDDAMERAAVYHRCYEQGDLDAARSGFQWLRDMSPEDPYIHMMLGVIAERQSHPLDALGEYLLGYHFDPGLPHQAFNLIRFLLCLGLYPLAFEVWKHYESCGRGGEDAERDRDVEALARWATPVLTLMVTASAEIGSIYLDPGSNDVLASFEPGRRPWLSDPPPIEDTLLDRARLFISYRRADVPDLSERLEHALAERHPAMNVFRDVTRMSAGERFQARVEKALGEAGAVLVVMGSSWSSPEGLRRLHTPGDYVRIEVAHALRMGKVVVPVLTGETPMPKAAELPDDIRELVQFHAERLRVDSFERDVNRLLVALARAFERRELEIDEFEATIEHSEQLRREDPEAAKRFNESWLGRAREELHHFVSVRAPLGVGVPSSLIQLVGTWETRAMRGAVEQFLLRFSTSDAPRSPVTGEKVQRDKKGRVRRTIGIEGRWHTIKDQEQNRVLGILLEVVEDGAVVREITVPFHKLLGSLVVGIDDTGTTFTSRRVG